jgi:periplasmic protein TonB
VTSQAETGRPPRATGRPRRISPILAGSLALHGAVILLLLLRWTGRDMPEPQSPPPAVAMVFEKPSGEATAPVPPRPDTTLPRGEETAPAEATPPPPPPPPTPMSEAAPPTPPTPAPAEQPAPQPAAEPPASSQATVTPPQVNLDDIPMPMEPVPEAEAVPPPPPPTPAPPRRVPQHAATRSAARPSRTRSASRSSRSSPFSSPMQLSFAPAQPPHSRRGTPSSRNLDLALGPMVRDGKLLDPVSHMNAPGATADWRNAVSAWVAAHKYYPEQAAEQGEDGVSVIRAVISRDGTVQSVQLLNRSGSQWLDTATLAIFRGQRLPAFPEDMPGGDVTVDLEMNYVLVR